MLNDLNLQVSVGPLELENPLILASGICDETWESMFKILRHGAAAVVTKSCGKNPRKGHRNPVITECPHGIINAMGLPNPGIDAMIDELTVLRTKLRSKGMVYKKIIISIFGSTPEEFVYLAKKASHVVDAIELNLSCPHAKGYGSEIGSNPKDIYDIVGAVKAEVSLPVFAKLTPNVTDIVTLAKAAYDAGADAVVAVNTLKAMAVDIETRQPLLANIVGGYSGPGIKPVALRAVYDIFQATHGNIIGVGGIMDYEDVIEYIIVGARAVEIGTAVYYKGEEVFGGILEDMKDWMLTHNIYDINDLYGTMLE